MNWWFNLQAGIGGSLHRQYLDQLSRQLRAEHSIFEGSVRMPWLSIGNEARPTVVFLHGFSDHKESFLVAARYLAPYLNLIVPDLPGFGASTKDADLTYDLAHYQTWVSEFLDHLPLDRFHLMGHSLGGAIATLVAEQQGERVESLCLVDAAGFTSDGHNQVYEELAQEDPFCLIKNWTDYRKFRNRMFHRKPKVPEWVQMHLAREAINKRAWFERLLSDLLPVEDPSELPNLLAEWALNQRLVQLDLPIHLIWGEQDRVFPPEMAQHVHGLLPVSNLDILIQSGHLPLIEKPEFLARAYRRFLKEKVS